MASFKRKTPKIQFDVSSIEEIQRAYQTRRIGLEMIKVARREVQAQIRALNEKRNIGKKISTIGLALI
ncbi:MAG: hypothetical protein N3F06_01035, partial [Nitrososphaerales archaeon]|nr:hypothetical protein [Nitrososphaerales archaeon]